MFYLGGKYILSVSDDKILRVWDIKNKRNYKILEVYFYFIIFLGNLIFDFLNYLYILIRIKFIIRF